MLALARRLPVARRAFADARIGAPLGLELAGRTLALVGDGRTGGRVRRLAEAIGMTVRSVRSAASRADLEALVAEADFVSLHCPLNPRTRGPVRAARAGGLPAGALPSNWRPGRVGRRARAGGAAALGAPGGGRPRLLRGGAVGPRRSALRAPRRRRAAPRRRLDRRGLRRD